MAAKTIISVEHRGLILEHGDLINAKIKNTLIKDAMLLYSKYSGTWYLAQDIKNGSPINEQDLKGKFKYTWNFNFIGNKCSSNVEILSPNYVYIPKIDSKYEASKVNNNFKVRYEDTSMYKTFTLATTPFHNCQSCVLGNAQASKLFNKEEFLLMLQKIKLHTSKRIVLIDIKQNIANKFKALIDSIDKVSILNKFDYTSTNGSQMCYIQINIDKIEGK